MGADFARGHDGSGARCQAGRRKRSRGAAVAGLALCALALGPAAGGASGEPVPEPTALIPEGAKLLATGETGLARLGRSVALSADGATAVIGGPRDESETGAAWIFTRSAAKWSQQTELAVGAANESGFFGRGVAISADGMTALVGDPGNGNEHGAAWVFTRTGTTWILQAKLEGAGEVGHGQFGRSVALSADGSTAIVGAFADEAGTGAAWVFTRTAGVWTSTAELHGGEELGEGKFGRSVALSADGATALVGGTGDNGKAGAAWVFTHSGTAWAQQGSKLTGGGETGAGEFGAAVALDAEGGGAFVGGSEDAGHLGAAWAFTRTGTTWAQDGAKLVASDESGAGRLGYSVALSADGTLALAGGPADHEKVGAAWVFHRTGAGWSQDGEKLLGEGEVGAGAFGIGVALGGTHALVGGNEDAGDVGAAWPFALRPEPVVEETHPPEKHTTTTFAPTGSQAVLGTTTMSGPVLARTGNIAPVSGKVRVRLPGTNVFVALTELRTVPFGTLVDATEGHVDVSTALPGGGDEQGEFFGGEFVLTQRTNGVVTATLAGGSRATCTRPAHHHGRRATVAARSKSRRKLWANAHGTFTTRGAYAAGAVQGTEWLTEDRCNGTLIRVTRDKVRVTDLVHHRTYIVRAGHSIFVRAH